MNSAIQPQAEMIQAVRVTAKRDGFRRAGRAWPASGTVVNRSELTEERIAALCAEPNLVVQFVEIPGDALKDAEGKPMDLPQGDLEKDLAEGGTPLKAESEVPGKAKSGKGAK